MTQEDLCVRFSDQTYATKQEVSKALGISMIDDIWNRILAYRSTFNRTLSLRNIEKSPYHITLTPTISERITSLERKLTKAMLQYSRLNDPERRRLIREERYIRILYWIAKKYHLALDDSFLLATIRHELSTVAPDDMHIVDYYETLLNCEKHFADPLNYELVSALYQSLSGARVAENENCYRKVNWDDNESRVVIGRTYNAAPVERIEPMMDDLFDFVVNASFSPLIKSLASFYLITHIKPFETHSEEIAVLFMKSVLAHHDLEDLAAILEWEQLLSDNEEVVSRAMNEVRKTNDLTYLLVYCLEVGETMASELLDQLAVMSVSSMRAEYYEVEKPAASAVPQEEEGSLPIAELNAPLSKEASSQIAFEMNVALPKMPIGLDERDAMKIEEHLVEIYPTLKRGQAYFYARHCTIGKYYTIAQYKRLLNCAYETARTSMDNLVDLGFYRKEKLNNKFIYTPVARK